MNKAHSLDRHGTWLIAGCLFFLALVLAVLGWQSTHNVKRDPVTLCQPGVPVTEEVAVLFDVTDRPMPAQLAAAIEWLRELELELPINARLTLWVLGSEGLERRFCRCYPGRESDPILHNPALSAATCDSLFSQPLREALDAAARAKPSPRTPIVEAIKAVTEQPEMSGGAHKQLIVISDLLENMKSHTFYTRVPSFTQFQSSSRFAQVRSHLQGVTVDVLYLPRGDEATSLSFELTDFWKAFFKACGASVVRIRRL